MSPSPLSTAPGVMCRLLLSIGEVGAQSKGQMSSIQGEQRREGGVGGGSLLVLRAQPTRKTLLIFRLLLLSPIYS